MPDLAELQARVTRGLPGLLGIRITKLVPNALHAELTLRPDLMAVNGYLHAGTVVSLADTAAGFGCVAHLPEGAESFTTIDSRPITSAPHVRARWAAWRASCTAAA